ncbi:hypothetical protein Tco_0997744 [Tanacetum coccineum]
MVARLPKTGWFSLAIFLECKVASLRGYGSCPWLAVDFLVAASTFVKVAFGVDFMGRIVRNFVIDSYTSRYVVPTGRVVKVPAGRYVVHTSKDNVIVSAGRTKVIPAGRTLLVLVFKKPTALDEKELIESIRETLYYQ